MPIDTFVRLRFPSRERERAATPIDHQTGYMFFSDLEGNFQMGIEDDLLVNARYTGGVDVIDFTDPLDLEEIAWNDPARNSGTWSAYPYTGPTFPAGGGNPVSMESRLAATTRAAVADATRTTTNRDS